MGRYATPSLYQSNDTFGASVEDSKIQLSQVEQSLLGDLSQPVMETNRPQKMTLDEEMGRLEDNLPFQDAQIDERLDSSKSDAKGNIGNAGVGAASVAVANLKLEGEDELFSENVSLQ